MDWVKLVKKSKSEFKCKKIFTMCIFNMKQDSYKKFEEEYYVPMLKLLNGLQKLFPDWGFIIYIDYFMIKTNYNLVKDLLNKYDENSRFLIYFYFIPKFLNEDNTNHEGTSGTMVRFIPFFDEENKYDIMWCIDIDELMNMFVITKKYFLDVFLEKKDVEFMVLSNTLHRYLSRYPLNKKYLIVAKGFVSKVQFPAYLLVNFMSPDRIKYDYEVERYAKGKKMSRRFPYGGDEWFLNTSLYDYIERKNMNVMVVIYPLIDFIGSLRWCSEEINEIMKRGDVYRKMAELGQLSGYIYNYEFDSLDSPKLKTVWNKYKELALVIRLIIVNELNKKNFNIDKLDERCRGKLLELYKVNKLYTKDLPPMYYKIIN